MPNKVDITHTHTQTTCYDNQVYRYYTCKFYHTILTARLNKITYILKH